MKKIFKTLLLVLFTLSFHAYALTDSEALEFTGAVNDGELKTVKRYVETMNVIWKKVILHGHPCLWLQQKIKRKFCNI